MMLRGSWLHLWIGLILVSVECRPIYVAAATTTAAILPGLSFFNKKEDESTQQKQQQENKIQQQQQQRPPPFPPRDPRQQGDVGRRGQLPPRQQQFMMERPPLPPPPRPNRSFRDGRQPLPPMHEGHRQQNDDQTKGSTKDIANAAPSPDAHMDSPHTATESVHGNQDEFQKMDTRSKRDHDDEATEEQQNQIEQREPPPPPLWPDAAGHFGSPFGGLPPPPGSWGGPPVEGAWGQPPPFDPAVVSDEQWRMHQQQAQQYYPPQDSPDYGGSDLMQQLRQELDDSLAREQDLLQEMHNITVAFGSLQSEEESRLEQVDMLTERVMDAEARASSERNAALEYRANCTELGHALALAKGEADEWKEQCEALQEENKRIETKLSKTTKDLRSRSLELEELALVVENLRLRDEHDKHIAERKKKKSGGLLAWLFGGFTKGYDSEEDLEDAQELARSTLLRALQTERNNVHELETAVSALQQNNSAISEVVRSRDSLINELNDRVAVFEEDKLVLKAALRQLQKEIKDEAPKTQKLVNDLKNAREETKELKAEIDELISSHHKEIVELQHAIALKQSALNDKESNLTVIGTYVDKLEDRLGDFAMARRDIEVREEKCKNIEEAAIQMGKERDDLKEKMTKMTAEQEEFKTLLEDLAAERTRVQQEMSKLQQERDELLFEEKRLQESITSMEDDVKELGEVLDEWKARVNVLEAEAEETRVLLQEANEAKEKALADLDAERAIVETTVEKQREAATFVSPPQINSEGRKQEFSQMSSAFKLPAQENREVPSQAKQDVSDSPVQVSRWESSNDETEEYDEEENGEENSSQEIVASSVHAEEHQHREIGEQLNPEIPRESPPPLLPPSGASDMPPPRRPPPLGQMGMQSNIPPSRGPPRKVPLRNMRKSISKRTGMHGFFTPSSSSIRKPPSPTKEKRRFLPFLGRKRTVSPPQQQPEKK